MASILRTGLQHINPTGLIVGLCKVTAKRGQNVVVTQVAGITGRELRQDRPPRPPPYDWRNKPYGFWQYLTDPMFDRFDDNSKIVVIEGMPTVGKDKLARKLAEELEMKYIPPPSLDDLYIDPYGFDLRSINDQIPAAAQYADFKTFFKDPKNPNVVQMQIFMLWARMSQYIDALAHVLSTGEGLVLQRTPWTDDVFMQAMANMGYVSQAALQYHKYASNEILPDFLRPHLIIYLDTPIADIKKNIKARNIPHEVNSKALTDEYLNDLERLYKEYLKKFIPHSNLLIYDWKTDSDVGAVVEDIERLDFDITNNTTLFHDWKYDFEYDLRVHRELFCNKKYHFLVTMMLPKMDVPEMFIDPNHYDQMLTALKNHPSTRYSVGFVPGMDKGLLFKSKQHSDDFLPRKDLPKTK